MKWSEEAWQAAEGIYEAILELPFLKELAAGTLPMEKFRFYISQDNQYIDVYSRVLAHIASRLPKMDDVDTFLGFAKDGVAVEKGLHQTFSPDTSAGKSMACEFYTSYLKSQADQDVAVETAAILPCFWIYLEVGKHILKIAEMEGNPYRDWIAAYSDPAFEESNQRCIDICDALAEAATEETRKQMTKAFCTCSRMEWLFWDSAYKMRM
ncbi:MAG: TenA family protein [Lachnospiraceae bacterium]|nr:TenA family protein [Lachnospiraceae bacterium]